METPPDLNSIRSVAFIVNRLRLAGLGTHLNPRFEVLVGKLTQQKASDPQWSEVSIPRRVLRGSGSHRRRTSKTRAWPPRTRLEIRLRAEEAAAWEKGQAGYRLAGQNGRAVLH
jgi:hypothetical protein